MLAARPVNSKLKTQITSWLLAPRPQAKALEAQKSGSALKIGGYTQAGLTTVRDTATNPVAAMN